MPSTPSPLLQLELQAPGENLNAWGEKLNAALMMIEKAIRGWQNVTVAEATTLASAPYEAGDATHMWLDLSGQGTLTLRAVPSVHVVRNGGTGPINLTTGLGQGTVVEANSITLVICDGTDVRQLGFGGDSLKAYIDEQLLSASAGNLPGQTGNSGKYLKTNGQAATWEPLAIAVANIAGFPSQLNNGGRLLTTNGSDLSWLALATSAEVRAAAAKVVSAASVFEAARSVEMTDAAIVAPPAGWNFHCGLGASGRTIDVPATLTNGQSGRFALTTGGAWAINWHGNYKKIGIFPPTFAAGGPHIFGYYFNGSTIELNYAGQRAA